LWAQEQYAHFIHAWQVQVGIWSAHLQAVRNLIHPAIAAMLRRAALFTMLLELQCVLPLKRIDGHAMLNMFASTQIWFCKIKLFVCCYIETMNCIVLLSYLYLYLYCLHCICTSTVSCRFIYRPFCTLSLCVRSL
jgi:hypothetical protein